MESGRSELRFARPATDLISQGLIHRRHVADLAVSGRPVLMSQSDETRPLTMLAVGSRKTGS